MDIRNRVALRIREIRKRRGLTQEDLASLIDRSVDAVSNFERGVSLANYETLERLAVGLEIPVADFFAEPEADRERTVLMTRLVDTARALDRETLEKAVGMIELLGGNRSHRD